MLCKNKHYKAYHHPKNALLCPFSRLFIVFQSLNRQKQEQYWNWVLFLFQYIISHRPKTTIRNLSKCFHMYIQVHGLGKQLQLVNCGLTFGVLVHFPFLASFMYAISSKSVSCKQAEAQLNQYQCQCWFKGFKGNLGHKDILCSWELFEIQGEGKHFSEPFLFQTCHLWLKA